MSEQSRKSAAEEEDQLQDQQEFEEDPRGTAQVSDQQPETEPARRGEKASAGRSGDEASAGETGGDEANAGETGRDEPGEATGNPASAG